MNKTIEALEKRVEYLKTLKDSHKEYLEQLKIDRDKTVNELAETEQLISEAKKAIEILSNKAW
jgi:hypothetical protein